MKQTHSRKLKLATEHANRKLRERLTGRKFDVWFTSDSGALTIRFKNGHCEIRPAIPKAPSPPVLMEDAHETDQAPESESLE